MRALRGLRAHDDLADVVRHDLDRTCVLQIVVAHVLDDEHAVAHGRLDLACGGRELARLVEVVREDVLEAGNGVVAHGFVDDARLGHVIVEAQHGACRGIGRERGQDFVLILGTRRFADCGGALQQLIEPGVEPGTAQRPVVRDTDDCKSGERHDQQQCQETKSAQHRGGFRKSSVVIARSNARTRTGFRFPAAGQHFRLTPLDLFCNFFRRGAQQHAGIHLMKADQRAERGSQRPLARLVPHRHDGRPEVQPRTRRRRSARPSATTSSGPCSRPSAPDPARGPRLSTPQRSRSHRARVARLRCLSKVWRRATSAGSVRA